MKGKNKYLVEVYKKLYPICLYFICFNRSSYWNLAKKGGFSISILLSLVFSYLLFNAYWREELADRNKVPALICMWSPM